MLPIAYIMLYVTEIKSNIPSKILINLVATCKQRKSNSLTERPQNPFPPPPSSSRNGLDVEIDLEYRPSTHGLYEMAKICDRLGGLGSPFLMTSKMPETEATIIYFWTSIPSKGPGLGCRLRLNFFFLFQNRYSRAG